MAPPLKYPTNELRIFHRAQNQRRRYREALARAAARTRLQNALAVAPAPNTNANPLPIPISPPVSLLSSVAQAATVPRKKRGRPRKNGAPKETGKKTNCTIAPAPLGIEPDTSNIPQPDTPKAYTPHITPPEEAHPTHITPPEEAHPSHITPPEEAHPSHITRSEELHPTHSTPPEEAHPPHITPPEEPHPPHITPPEEAHPTNFTQPEEAHPAHITPPEEPHPPHITPPENPHPYTQLGLGRTPKSTAQQKREHRNAYQRHWRDKRKTKLLATDPTARPYSRPLKSQSSKNKAGVLAIHQSQPAKPSTSLYYLSQSRIWRTLVRAATTWLPAIASQNRESR